MFYFIKIMLGKQVNARTNYSGDEIQETKKIDEPIDDEDTKKKDNQKDKN